MSAHGRPLFRDTLMSILGVAVVLAIVIWVDATIRQDVVGVLQTPPAAVLDDAGARTEDVLGLVVSTAKYASTEQTILFAFVASAAVLAFYVGRR
jgi:hypothetical protein